MEHNIYSPVDIPKTNHIYEKRCYIILLTWCHHHKKQLTQLEAKDLSILQNWVLVRMPQKSDTRVSLMDAQYWGAGVSKVLSHSHSPQPARVYNTRSGMASQHLPAEIWKNDPKTELEINLTFWSKHILPKPWKCFPDGNNTAYKKSIYRWEFLCSQEDWLAEQQ